MKRKFIIVIFAVWITSIIGGGIWGWIETYWKSFSVSPSQVELNNLKDMYNAKLYSDMLAECDRAGRDPRYKDLEPQILYIQWASAFQLGRTDESSHLQEIFLQRFPDHILAADMHFSVAMNRFVSGDYAIAKNELLFVCSHYPTATVTAKADQMIKQIDKLAPTTIPLD